MRSGGSPFGASTSTSRARVIWGMVLAVVGTVALVAAFLPVRDDITPLSKGFGFLMLVTVVVPSGGCGRASSPRCSDSSRSTTSSSPRTTRS
jgi:hypothetical protein